MKELFFVAAVFLILMLALMPQERISAAQQEPMETQVKDYYYSAQSAAWWHEINREYGSEKLMVNKVNGIAFTERVAHGEKPICNVTDAVLVASGVDGDGLTVEYTNIAW